MLFQWTKPVLVYLNYGSQWLPLTIWLLTFFKISSQTHTVLEQPEGANIDHIFNFKWAI